MYNTIFKFRIVIIIFLSILHEEVQKCVRNFVDFIKCLTAADIFGWFAKIVKLRILSKISELLKKFQLVHIENL